MSLDKHVEKCTAFICPAQLNRDRCFYAVKCKECNISTNYKLDPYSSIDAWNKGIKNGQVNYAQNSSLDTGKGESNED